MQSREKWFQGFVRESNRIEGITREPTEAELSAHSTFFKLDRVSVFDLEMFVDACQPGARLRLRPGMDVRVGDHEPPEGGPGIGYSLDSLIRRANDLDDEACDPYSIHVEYETLHPFMDGNGRSGRVLWAWMMNQRADRMVRLGFLHAWYYQSLSRSR